MKCIQYHPQYIKDGAQFARVTDAEAHDAVAAGKATYAPKSAWKKHVRDASHSDQE